MVDARIDAWTSADSGPQFAVACFLPVFVTVAGNAGTQSVVH